MKNRIENLSSENLSSENKVVWDDELLYRSDDEIPMSWDSTLDGDQGEEDGFATDDSFWDEAYLDYHNNDSFIYDNYNQDYSNFELNFND